MTQRISDERLQHLLCGAGEPQFQSTFPERYDLIAHPEHLDIALDLRDARAQLAERDQRIAAMEAALREAVSNCANGRVASIGSIGNVRVPQIDVSQIDRWRAALSPPPAASGGEKCEPAEGDAK